MYFILLSLIFLAIYFVGLLTTEVEFYIFFFCNRIKQFMLWLEKKIVTSYKSLIFGPGLAPILAPPLAINHS